ncbi:MAG: alpha,6-mannosyltransferase [Solirubrobacteraceae bacterium]|nr:alpha,6-mannosyltransferase [Solirubrobacteraceae bacterium]
MPRSAAAAVAGAGAAAVVGATTWLVLAAAERPGTLSPPSLRAHATHPWVLGPLHGLMPGLSASPRRLHADVVVVLVVIGVGWVAAWVAAPALGARALLGATAAAHVVLFLGPPLALTDVFNYGLYGRMAALHGLNPYRAFPAQAAADPLYPLANWHHLRSPYGPLFTLGTEALTPLGTHGWLWAWKAIVVLSSLATVLLAAALAQRLGASRPRAIAALGLSPLLLVSEVGGFHQDVPALACVVAAAWCLVRGRDADAPRWADPAAGALVVAAAGIKPSFGIVVGLVVLGATRRPRAIAGAAVAGAVVGIVVLIAYGGALPDLSTQGRLVTPLSVPNLLGLAAGHQGADQSVRSAAQVVLVAVALIATAAVAVRRRWALSAIGLVLFCAVLGLAWVMPWYLVWALPFIAVGRPRFLAPLAVVATCWLAVGSLPQLPGILHSAGYFPTRTSTGLQNHREFVRLVR